MKQQKNNSKNNVNMFNFISKKYSSYIFDTTLKYQKKYGFQIGTGEHATWNNEADAFKHTFMQAQLSLWIGKHLAKGVGDFHEFQGNISMGQSSGEDNMDNWNNQQGREIAKEILYQYGPLATIPSDKINDIIAEKVMSRMHSGKLILNPNDKRQYSDYKNNLKNSSTGYAAPVNTNEQQTDYQEFETQNKSEFYGYTNPLTGNNRIFTREDLDIMSGDDFAQKEKEIMSQMNTIGIPTNGDMKRESMLSGDVIYVHPYVRSDGTSVSGYYRSRARF